MHVNCLPVSLFAIKLFDPFVVRQRQPTADTTVAFGIVINIYYELRMNYLSHHLHNESLINKLSAFVLVLMPRKKGKRSGEKKVTETQSRAEERLPTEAT